MKKRTSTSRRTLVLTLAAVSAVAGCQRSNIDLRAEALAGEVRDHRDRQAARVSKINADFDARFSAQMTAYEDTLERQTRVGRDADAQKIADQLIVDLDNQSLRGKFREAFAYVVAEERREIAKADEAVATTRAAYEASYQQAALELKRLNRVHELLLELAAGPDQLRVASQAIRMAADAYAKARVAEEQKAKASAASAADGGN
jgi:hypothetical protein